MKRITASVLGIAVSEQEFFIAEIGSSPNASVTRTATFPLSAPLAQPQELGDAFRLFLKKNGFSASKAVIGLPAKWITAKPWPVPPATPTAAAAILRLAAERQFPPELKDFVFDYAGKTDASQASTVLLAGTSQQRINQLTDIAEAANLGVLGVTSSSLALSAALRQTDREKILVALGSDSTELVINAGNGPRSLRHLAIPSGQLVSSNGNAAPAVALLGSELMRASLAGEGPAQELLLWDSLGLRDDALAILRDRYNLNLSTARDLSPLNLAGAKEISTYGPAAALALLAVRGQELPVNFLKTRLAPPKQRKIGRNVLIGAGVAVLILAGIAWSIWSIQNQQSQLNRLNDQIKQQQPLLTTARAMDSKVTTADQWYANRTSALACMEHITQAFPQAGTIWATNISMRDNGVGTITGLTRDQGEVLAVYDRMKNDSKFFTHVVVNDIRQGAGSNNRQITFSISFVFTPYPTNP